MRNSLIILSVLATLTAVSGCNKSEPLPPPAADAATSSAPVKNVESLPSGTIREGARTMNKGADMGSTLEEQKQERNKEMEAQSK